MAKGVIDTPFAVINADDFYGASSLKVLADYLRATPDFTQANYAMVGFVLRNTVSEFGTVSRGICRCDGEGRLSQVIELPKIKKHGYQVQYLDETGKTHPLSGDETVSMNIWGFTPSIFDHLQHQFVEFLQRQGRKEQSEFFIPTVVNSLIAQGQAQVKVLSGGGSWFGITYRQDKPLVIKKIQTLIAQGLYPENLDF